MATNKTVKRPYVRDFILAKDFASMVAPNVTPALASLTSSGGPVLENVNSTGLSGANMSTAGELIRTLWVPRYGLDGSKRIYYRVHYTSASADTADTVTWKVLFASLTPNSTRLNSLTVNTPLTSAIAADAVPVAATYTYAVSERGYMDPVQATVTATKTHAAAFVVDVEMDAKAAGLSEDIFLLGLEIEYVALLDNTHDDISNPIRGVKLPWV